MTELSLPVSYFKGAAKSLYKEVVADHREARQRARMVFADLANKSDRDVAAAFPLMRAQHVVAIEHGFAKWEELAHASSVQLHLAITMAKLPDLTDFGIGLYAEHRKLPPEERNAIFTKEREDLRKSADRVARVIDWLQANVLPTRTINVRRTSYGLKHCAEEDTGYITNGVFIAAAVIAGFTYRIKPRTPNVAFGMSERSIDQWIKRNRLRQRPDRHYVSDDEQRAAPVAAGWSSADRDSWVAPPGTAPPGEWPAKAAFGYFLLGEAMRSLAMRGWHVPSEYIGQIGATTLCQHVKHPTKAPRLIRVSTALDLEGLPRLHPLAAERA